MLYLKLPFLCQPIEFAYDLLYVVIFQMVNQIILELSNKFLAFTNILDIVTINCLWSIFHFLRFCCRTVFRMIKMFYWDLFLFANIFEVVIVKKFLKIFLFHSFFVLFFNFEIFLHLFKTFLKNKFVVFFRSFLRLVFKCLFYPVFYLLSILLQNRNVFLVLSVYNCLEHQLFKIRKLVNFLTVLLTLKKLFKDTIELLQVASYPWNTTFRI